jgi:hypothetical protein
VLFPKIVLCDFRRDAQSKNPSSLSFAHSRHLALSSRAPVPSFVCCCHHEGAFCPRDLLFAFRPFVAQGALTAFVSGPGAFAFAGAPRLCSKECNA